MPSSMRKSKVSDQLKAFRNRTSELGRRTVKMYASAVHTFVRSQVAGISGDYSTREMNICIELMVPSSEYGGQTEIVQFADDY